MKIHAIQTGTVQVKTAFLRGSVAAGGTLPFLIQLHRDYPYVDLPIYAWVIEYEEGVIVVDTGDIHSTAMTWLIQTRRVITPEQEIGPQLRQLGIGKKDVSQVVLTHIHGDHVNGVKHFPDTPVWISEREYTRFHSAFGRVINRMTIEVPAWFKPQPFVFKPESFGSFEQHYPLTKRGDVVVVPTPGHTPGHVSVIAVQDSISYFLAGDVTYDEAGLLNQTLQGPSESPSEHPGTLAQVLQYTQIHPTVYLPAHDTASGQRLQAIQVVPSSVKQPLEASATR
jgi:glyoxylase-like metal-dependent hydrolase (beta-lactamase superfamily II)